MLKRIWADYKPEIILIPLIFALDRLSKIWALAQLQHVGSIQIAPFFRLTYVENTGTAFGIFQNANYFWAAMAFIVLIMLFKWRSEFLKAGPGARYALIFIMAGALGNLYDRMVLGYVVDYFDFIIWPVFNIADSFISIGAVILAVLLLKDIFGRKNKNA